MLRITRVEDTPERLHLRLEGRLVGAWVALFDDEVSRADDAMPSRILLDLASVDFANEAGLSALQEALGRGAELISCSPLLRALLGKEACHDA